MFVTGACTLNHTAPSPIQRKVPATAMEDLRRTESLETLPDISATTLSQDMRELSAWYRTPDTPSDHGTPQSLTPSDPSSSSSDGRDVSLAPPHSRGFVRHASILSQTSTLTSLESDAETESTLTSLESGSDAESSLTCFDPHLGEDSHKRPTVARRGKPNDISLTTSMSPSKPSRKRKRKRFGEPARASFGAAHGEEEESGPQITP